MRKLHLQQILDLLKTIQELQTAKQYADCQEGALYLCDFIDDIKGKGTKTVSLLEEYCESLFRANAGELSEKVLSKLISKIYTTLISELKPNKIEIAFFPYKASMFDSLESIWRAAKDDPQCDTYVIPIPYYDHFDRKLSEQMYYDGNDFPRDVPIVNWEEYDIEARRPDVIFIHNPYDDINLMTSVHPDFYSKRLRKYTDLLVYSPYYVSDDKKGVMDHFCIVPGCSFSHKVILQSEMIRSFYIDIFKKVYGDKIGKPEDKFIALGSPKFDAVINAKRENYILPEHWFKTLDGKKVVLYNTSVGSILYGKFDYLKKLCAVLEFFSNRDDIVLWWRPHPLVETSCASIHPSLLESYKKIVTAYKQGSWGIFDETSDLYRAIAWSDAYFGDPSSVVSLYKATGKPIRLQYFYAEVDFANVFCATKKDIWFTTSDSHALLCYDTQSKHTALIEWLPEAHTTERPLFNSITAAGNMLFMSPEAAHNIYAYNIDDNTFSSIDLPLNKDITFRNPNYDEDMKFETSFAYGEYIFFVGSTYPAIIRIHSTTFEMECFTDWADEIIDISGSLHTWDACVAQNTIAITVRDYNSIILFDMDSCTHKIKEVGNYDTSWMAIGYDGTHFWLSAEVDLLVVRWNPKNDDIKKYSNFPEELPKNGRHNFNKILWFNNRCWLFPSYGNAVVSIEPNTGKIKTEKSFKEHYTFKNAYQMAKVFDDTIVASRKWEKSVEIFGKGNIEELTISLDVIPTQNRNTQERYWRTPSALIECINDTRTKKRSPIISPLMDGLAGKRILEHVKNTLLK